MSLAASIAGYHLFDRVFDAGEVAALRACLLDALDTPPGEGDTLHYPHGRDVRVDLFRYPSIYRKFFTARLISTLKVVSGEWGDDAHFVLMPGHSFHRNGFGAGLRDWHKDTDGNERAGFNFHWYSGYRLVHCATYLQDSTQEWGGGLSVIPGSHKIPNPYGMLEQPQLRHSWYGDKTFVVIESKAGDLLCFDTKLDHYATPRATDATPPYGPKLALFFSIAPRDEFTQMYSDYLHSRPDYAFLKGCRIPDDMQELAAANNFSFQL